MHDVEQWDLPFMEWARGVYRDTPVPFENWGVPPRVPATIRECRHCCLACRLIAMCGHAVVQITNAYRVHEPTSGLGLLASALFGKATELTIRQQVRSFFSKKAGDKISSSHIKKTIRFRV